MFCSCARRLLCKVRREREMCDSLAVGVCLRSPCAVLNVEKAEGQFDAAGSSFLYQVR